jgi:ankyrin repeat protein
MTACSNGHLNIVKNLINSGATINDNDSSNLTALIYAAENGHLEIVKILLENKAKVNVLSDNGFSPLIISAAYGHFEIVQVLVTAGAIIDMEHPDNVTPLMYAVAGGFEDIVRYFIDKGSNINQIDNQGNSAMLEASSSGNIEVIHMLLDAGANPLLSNKNGLNTVMLAASQGRVDAVNLLLTKNINIDELSYSGVSAIMYSIGGGHYDTTKILIDNGADINKSIISSEIKEEFIDGIELYKNGATLLIMAIQVGNVNILELLLSNGVDINKPDINGITPFIIAMKEKKFDIAYYLLLNHCDFVDHYIENDKKYHSLLMDSIQVSDIDLSLLLIKKGANILYIDETGISIALQASFLNLYDIIFELINRNADMNLVNKEGMSPLIVAASEGNLKTIQTLLQYSKNIDINIKDNDNTTALMTACVRGHKDIVNELNMVADIDLNAKNIDGHTALMFAYNGKNQVEILYNKYSKYKQNDMDETYNIIKIALENHIYIISLLIDNGSDISIRDNDGHIAIDFDYKPPPIDEVSKLINHNIEL